MGPQLAISDPLPVFRVGVAAILADFGVPVDTPSDLRAWCARDSPRLAILTVLTNRHWLLMEELRELPHASVIAVLPDGDADSELRAFKAGAVGVVHRDIEPHALRKLVADLLDGRASLPVGVLRQLISGDVEPPNLPSATELEWLEALAHGATVADLAHRAGYSERMMFRLLREVYQKLGVTRRVDALLVAKERRLLA